MDFFTTRYIWWAVLLGAISAVSLPLGSALGLLLELSCFPLLKDISPEHINSLLSVIHPVKFVAGDIIAKQGVAGTELIPGAIHHSSGKRQRGGPEHPRWFSCGHSLRTSGVMLPLNAEEENKRSWRGRCKPFLQPLSILRRPFLRLCDCDPCVDVT